MSAAANGGVTALRVAGLTVGFDTPAGFVEPVRDVSFELSPGERLALVGESGSGKSLTALAIMRLVRPAGAIRSGAVHFGDVPLLEISEREMARVRGARIAMIYQNPMSALNPVRSVGHQLVEAIRLHEGVSKAAARARAVELLDRVGVPSAARRVDSYPFEFSGGMRQRVVIAMALSCNPSLLIADEPTTALDVTTQARILRLLDELVDELGSAVLFVTHDLDVAAEFCNRIQVMYAGEIVETGVIDAVQAAPAHPYTEALLTSKCGLDVDVDEPIAAIPGLPPLPGRLPSGCPFHPRCPHRQEICESVEPALEPVRPGRASRCHFAAEVLASAGAVKADP
ncbi:MAG: ABC transporter ATP-binding protein [Solirubrobacterales bacterium]